MLVLDICYLPLLLLTARFHSHFCARLLFLTFSFIGICVRFVFLSRFCFCEFRTLCRVVFSSGFLWRPRFYFITVGGPRSLLFLEPVPHLQLIDALPSVGRMRPSFVVYMILPLFCFAIVFPLSFLFLKAFFGVGYCRDFSVFCSSHRILSLPVFFLFNIHLST